MISCLKSSIDTHIIALCKVRYIKTTIACKVTGSCKCMILCAAQYRCSDYAVYGISNCQSLYPKSNVSTVARTNTLKFTLCGYPMGDSTPVRPPPLHAGVNMAT